MLKYCQESSNSYCFSSLVSAFDIINQTKAANSIAICIEESLKIEVGNRVDFDNDILNNERKLR